MKQLEMVVVVDAEERKPAIKFAVRRFLGIFSARLIASGVLTHVQSSACFSDLVLLTSISRACSVIGCYLCPAFFITLAEGIRFVSGHVYCMKWHRVFFLIPG